MEITGKNHSGSTGSKAVSAKPETNGKNKSYVLETRSISQESMLPDIRADKIAQAAIQPGEEIDNLFRH